MIGKPYGLSCNELGTFIPYRLAMRVGIMRIREIEVSCFMISPILFPITEAYASIIPARMSLYILEVSRACLISISTSST